MADRDQLPSDAGARPILAAVDGSHTSLQAVAWAATEATLHDHALHIVTSFGAAPKSNLGAVLAVNERPLLRRQSELILAEATAMARHTAPVTDLVVTTELTFELIEPVLIERSAQVRMIVVGSHGRGALGRVLLGSVSTAIARGAHCPVAVIHGGTPILRSQRPILVGIDGTANSIPALEVAFDEAARRAVGVMVLHARRDTDERDRFGHGAEIRLEQSLAGCAERYPQLPVDRITVADNPAHALLEYADKAQTVVVGTHGRGGLAGLGSTSTALLHRAELPVIVVRPE